MGVGRYLRGSTHSELFVQEQRQQLKRLPHVQAEAALQIQARHRGRRGRRRALIAKQQVRVPCAHQICR